MAQQGGSLRLRKLGVDALSPSSTVLMVGKRKTGKTTLTQAICSALAKKVDFCVAFSGTDETTQSLSQFIPPGMIYNTWRADIVEQLMAIQRAAGKRGKQYNILIIADDVFYDKSIFTSKTLRELMMNGRHRYVTVYYIIYNTCTYTHSHTPTYIHTQKDRDHHVCPVPHGYAARDSVTAGLRFRVQGGHDPEQTETLRAILRVLRFPCPIQQCV